MTFIGVVTFVGAITVILMAAVKIWIYSNIRVNKGPAATEAMEPKQNNDVDNNGGFYKFLWSLQFGCNTFQHQFQKVQI
ncbi:hypothetical protein GPALN_016233 [Globodera pallida]|nr:hypothetical protein GPALN_016233 [Globodera pallida]